MNRRHFFKMTAGALVGVVAGPMLGRVRGMADGEEEAGVHGVGLIIDRHEGEWEFHPAHLEFHQGDKYDLHLTATEGEHRVVIPFLEGPVDVKVGEVAHAEFSLEGVETGDYAISMLGMAAQAEVHVLPPCLEDHEH